MSKNTYAAIMAGGIGSRFWPGSRTERPKQFLDILGVGKSLIQLTYERFLTVCPKENILIVTNKIYKDLVKEHLPDLTDNQILCEPSRNNTAPCVAYTALKINALNPNANLIIAPSDHVIMDQSGFTRIIETAVDFADKNNALLTLGIKPSNPNTGYGYINFAQENENSVHKVKAFTEKPDLETAKKFVDSGEYLWNAGIFIWNIRSILEAYSTLSPEIFEILSKGNSFYNTDREQTFIDEAYPTTPNISVDYAIMEKAQNVYTIPSEFGWSDLGTWASLFNEMDKDDNGNVTNSDNIFALETTNSLIRLPKDKLLVVKGLEDYIIVDEDDALLIYPKSQEQEIKKVVEQIKVEKGDKYL